MEKSTKDFYWKVGSRIRTFRLEKKYSVEELSERAGISTKYMYQIESGRVNFSTEILFRIANVLGVPTDAILKENKVDIASVILSELTGKFTDDEKEYIRKAVLKEIAKEI